jgi:indole-3-glycerol phosphate synthase
MIQVNSSSPSLPAEPENSRSMLERIVWYKHKEIAQMREQISVQKLQQAVDAPRSDAGFLTALKAARQQPSLIAEVKKASPSRGVIRSNFNPVAIAQAYERAGATCISVLTDRAFFQGGFEYLLAIRQAVRLPLLCKEFIIDLYQIYLARSVGADAVLLIAAILSDEQLQEFLCLAHSLGMNALIEVHTLVELDRVLALSEVYLVGINNRSLSDFTVDLHTTQSLMAARRAQFESLDITVVSESGIHQPSDINLVSTAGARAVLVGESLLKQPDIEQAVYRLLPVLS